MTTLDRLERQLVSAVQAPRRPMVPPAGRLLWSCFSSLHRARRYGMAGAQPIAFSEIQAFAQIERLPLQPHHVRILRAMDDAWLVKARRSSKDLASRVSDEEISPESFDAFFG